jgi:hypothetical protein
MNAKFKVTPALLLAAVLLIAACGPKRYYDWSERAPVKIRVKTTTAVLRLSASPKGEVVVDKVAKGTVFEVVRKTGAWYEVRHRSEIGVLLTAYISESDVDPIAAEAAPPIKRT